MNVFIKFLYPDATEDSALLTLMPNELHCSVVPPQKWACIIIITPFSFCALAVLNTIRSAFTTASSRAIYSAFAATQSLSTALRLAAQLPLRKLLLDPGTCNGAKIIPSRITY